MWHNVSHTSRTINSPKGIRIGQKIRFSTGLTLGEKEGDPNFFLISMEICQSEFIELRVKDYLLDEGYAYVLKSWDFTENPKEEIWGKSRVAG